MIELSENAAKRILFLMQKDAGKEALRIEVLGGGCSGFRYDMKLVDAQNDDDIVIESHGAKLYIDETSATMMEDAIVDYVETLGAAHFEIKNPQADASCGCGNSFSV